MVDGLAQTERMVVEAVDPARIEADLRTLVAIPSITDDERLGQWHFWCSMVFFNVAFFPMHCLGLAGMPRRIPDYSLQFADFNVISSLGAFGFGLSQLLPLAAIVKCVRGGEPAEPRAWEGAQGLEWLVPSPAQHHTWEEPPRLQ